MKLTAITTCVGYDDYLRVSMPVNEDHFDWWCILTEPDVSSGATELAEFQKHGDYYQMGAFFKDGASFNKGAAINEMLWSFGTDEDWFLLLDADILLPDNFRENLEKCDLDKDCIYGMYREECDDVQRFLDGDRTHLVKQHGNPRRSIGLGMFTLFHWDSQTMRERREAGGPLYPDNFPTAERSDRFHLKRWRKEHRGPNARGSAVGIPLPDSMGKMVHFGPDPVRSKANHEGRTSPRIDESAERTQVT